MIQNFFLRFLKSKNSLSSTLLISKSIKIIFAKVFTKKIHSQNSSQPNHGRFQWSGGNSKFSKKIGLTPVFPLEIRFLITYVQKLFAIIVETLLYKNDVTAMLTLVLAINCSYTILGQISDITESPHCTGRNFCRRVFSELFADFVDSSVPEDAKLTFFGNPLNI